MRRRELITSLGGAVAVACWSSVARGQTPSKRPLIVWLGSGTTAAVGTWVGFLRKGLEELGYVDGRDIDLVIRMAENQAERLPGLAEEVVALQPAVIVAGAVDAALVARKATSSIPIISGALADADHLGLIASYARPGGNVTGITPYVAGLPAKQIELARELVSGAVRIGVLGNMNDPKAPPQRDELLEAARTLGLTVVVRDLKSADGLSEAVEELASESVHVVVVLQTSMLLSLRKPIAPLMAAKRLPAVYGYRQHVDEGGLVSYGVNLGWCWQHLATYVHKILSGASPADLPVEFPPRLQLVVNQKVATSLGITVPPILLARADEVIEQRTDFGWIAHEFRMEGARGMRAGELTDFVRGGCRARLHCAAAAGSVEGGDTASEGGDGSAGAAVSVAASAPSSPTTSVCAEAPSGVGTAEPTPAASSSSW